MNSPAFDIGCTIICNDLRCLRSTAQIFQLTIFQSEACSSRNFDTGNFFIVNLNDPVSL